MKDTEIITADLTKFDQEALHTGAELLTQLARSNIEFDSPLHLKTNTATHDTFLGNADIALAVGDNGNLHELEMDDYAREFQSDTELKYGKDSDKFYNASLLHRELVEYENILGDLRESNIQEAVNELDPDQRFIIKHLDQLLEQDIDTTQINADEMEALADSFDTIQANIGTDVSDTQTKIRQTLSDLVVNLES